MGALTTLCALFAITQAAGGSQLKAHICQSGHSFDANALIPGSSTTCDMMVTGALDTYLSQTSLTPEQCQATTTTGMSVHSLLLYIQSYCCGGESLPTHGVCGNNFPEGNACMDPSTFDSMADSGFHYCEGEQDQDETVCKSAGVEAWDPSSDQKCDVDRIPGLNEDQQREACTKARGTLEPLKCISWHMSFQSGFSYAQVCETQQRSLFEMMGATCCRHPDGRAAAASTMCEGAALDPSTMIGPGSPSAQCTNIEKTMEQRLIDFGVTPVYCDE